MIPGDLANASFTREGGGLEGADEGQGETEAVDRKATDAATQENSNQGEEDCTNSRDSAFLCVKARCRRICWLFDFVSWGGD